MIPTRTHLTAALALTALLTACSDDLQAPIAAIIAPESAALGATVVVDGSASSDPTGNALSFAWSFTSLPPNSNATFNDPTLVRPSFVVDEPGEYALALLVSNGFSQSAPAFATITVSPCGNNPPVINALNADPSSPQTGETIRFGAQISDPDNAAGCSLNQRFEYTWRLVELPTESVATLNDVTLPSPWLVADVSGTYGVDLQVTDSGDLTSLRESFTVTVSDCREADPEIASVTATPSAPQIDDVVVLTAVVEDADNTGACDAGQTFTYAWTLVTAPSESLAEVQRADLEEAWFQPDVPGDYTLRLVVADSTGRSSAPMTVSFEAGGCGSHPPVLDAVTPSTTSPNTGDRVQLSVTVSDEDTEAACGDPALFEYDWSLVTIPSGSFAQLSRDDIANPTFTPDVPGTYVVRVEVSDSRGLTSGTTEITLTAADCGSHPPVASLSSEPADPVAGSPVVIGATVADGDLDDGSGTDTCTLGDRFTYDWRLRSVPAGSLVTLATNGSPTTGFVPDVDGAYIVEVDIFDEAGHENEGQRELTITVATDEAPTAEVSATPLRGLAPLTVAFTCSSATGEAPFAYAWTFGNGSTSSARTPNFTYTLPGAYTATCLVTDADGDTDLASVQVTAETDTTPQVQAGANPRAGTAPLSVTFTSVVDGGNGLLTYDWRFADGGTSTLAAPSHVFAAAGDYSVILTVTDEDGDQGTALVAIAVATNDTPAVAGLATPNAGIAPLTVFFSAETAGGNGTLRFTWDFDISNGVTVQSTLRNPSFTYTTPGLYTARVTVTDDDGDSDSGDVVVDVAADSSPAGSVVVTTNPDPATGLSPLLIGFGCSATTGNPPLRYQWDFGDGDASTLQNPTHQYQAGGTFTPSCTVTDINGDSGSDAATVIVEQDTSPQIVLTAAPLSGFAPLDVTFGSEVTAGNGVLSYSWNFGEGGAPLTGTVDAGVGTPSDIAGPTNTYESAGSYQVTLVVTDADGDTDVETIQIAVGVDSLPAVSVTATPRQGTSPLQVQLRADVAGGDGPLQFAWDFGDSGTSTAQNPLHTYTYTDAPPAPQQTTFTAEVTVTDADGDPASASVVVTVFRDDSPAGNVVVTATPTTGLTPLAVAFTCTASTGNPPFTYAWSFGDGGSTTLRNPSHVYEQGGSYVPRCTVTDGDGDTGFDEIPVTITPDSTPVVAISGNPLAGLAPLTTVFASTVTDGNAPFIYAWDFGDGGVSPDPNPTHAYGVGVTGTFLVRLTVTDNDGDVGTDTLQVAIGTDGVPSVSGRAVPRSGVEPLAVQLLSSVAGGNPPVTVEWDFDFDGVFVADSTAANPTTSYSTAGTDRVVTARVRATDGDGDSATADVSIDVFADLDVVAAVTPLSSTGLQPWLVDFTCAPVGPDLGNPPLSYAWAFGDGATSTLANPTHIYEQSGPFTAQCTITDVDGDSDSASSSITVTPDTVPLVALQATPLSGVAPLSVTFSSTVTSGNPPFGFVWDFGNGGPGSTDEDPAAPVVYAAGLYRVTLTVTDSDGDVAVTEATITVAADSTPSVAVSASPRVGIEPLTVQFGSQISGGNPPLALAWDFNWDTVPLNFNVQSTASSPSFAYLDGTGNPVFTAALRVTDVDGDIVYATITVTVLEDLPIAVDALPQTVPDVGSPAPLAPALVSFTCSPLPGFPGNAPVTYTWDFGDGTSSSLRNPSHTYLAGGTYTARCTATDGNLDSAFDEIPVTIQTDTTPFVALSANPINGIEPLAVQFSSAVTGGNGDLTYNWVFGNGAILIDVDPGGAAPPAPPVGLLDPVNTYASGIFLARLTVVDADGDSGSDTVLITVDDDLAASVVALASPNRGADPLVVQFTATPSGNPPFSYSWDFDDGSALSTQQNPQHTYATQGNFVAEVTLTDEGGTGEVATDTVTVQVFARPTAVAGPDRCAETGTLVALNGSGSVDNNAPPQPLSYVWAFVSKPAGSTATLNDPNLRNPTFVPDLDGLYEVRLTVNNGFATEPDELVVEAGPRTLGAVGSTDRDGVAETPIDPDFEVALFIDCDFLVEVALSGQLVTWTSGQAALDFATTTTDLDGLTTNGGSFGAQAGLDTVTASHTGVDPVVFNLDVDCANFTHCTAVTNGACLAGVCQNPTCTDGIANQDETDVDCGGPTCAARCDWGQMCVLSSDCDPLAGTEVLLSCEAGESGLICAMDGVWLVDPNGGSDGLTWASAFTDPQQAIDEAAVGGGQVWIADGTYSPGNPAGYQITDDDIAIYGGFSGLGGDEERTRAARGNADPTLTVLSGGGSTGVLSITGANDVVVESLTVTNGSALDGAGLRVDGSATLRLTNLVVSNNVAVSQGGGAWLSDSTYTIAQSVFALNSSGAEGGALWAGGVTSGLIERSRFELNSTPAGGGAIALGSDAVTEIINSVFWGNTGTIGSTILSSGLGLSLLNSTLYGDDTGVGAVSVLEHTPIASLDIVNTLVWNCVPCVTSSTGVTGFNFAFQDETTPGCNPNFFDGASGDLRLVPGIPPDCIDEGDNGECPTVDYLGVARPASAGNACDIGAYEFDSLLASFDFDAFNTVPSAISGDLVSVSNVTTPAGSQTFPTGNPGQAFSTTQFVVSNYFEFQVNIAAGTELNLTGFSFDEARSPSGPPDWTLRLVDAGDASIDVGTGLVTGTTAGPNFISHLVDAGFVGVAPYTTSVRVRLVGANATGATGTFRIDNLRLHGYVTLLP